MGWFTKRSDVIADVKQSRDESRVEIITHKKATKATIDETKRVNSQLNRLLAKNGFTLKIYLASGGSHLTRKRG